MKFYQEMIDRLCNIILSGKLEYKNIIIIGDNSSGKSDVLRKIIENKPDEKAIHFIDAVNRYFSVEQIQDKTVDERIIYSLSINKQRISYETFNLVDTFYYEGMPRAIEDFYVYFGNEAEKLMSEFLQESFEIHKDIVGRSVYVNNENVDLSSGYQALIRIFMEILYFQHSNKTGIIVIDEIDEFLSVKNSGRILNFLKEKFSNYDFIVTTHSADLIANAKKMNLILLEDGQFEILDADDFAGISQVYDVFNSVFGKKQRSDKEKTDDVLRRLFNNRISDIWDKEDILTLEKIKEGSLTKAQRLIIKQIEEWQN